MAFTLNEVNSELVDYLDYRCKRIEHKLNAQPGTPWIGIAGMDTEGMTVTSAANTLHASQFSPS